MWHLCPVASSTEYVEVRTRVQSWMCVRIPTCLAKLATGHKPFPNKIRVVRLLAVLSCKSNVVHVDFGLTTKITFYFWEQFNNNNRYWMILTLEVCLDTVYCWKMKTYCWKHYNKIIFKDANGIVGPSFKVTFAKFCTCESHK